MSEREIRDYKKEIAAKTGQDVKEIELIVQAEETEIKETKEESEDGEKIRTQKITTKTVTIHRGNSLPELITYGWWRERDGRSLSFLPFKTQLHNLAINRDGRNDTVSIVNGEKEDNDDRAPLPPRGQSERGRFPSEDSSSRRPREEEVSNAIILVKEERTKRRARGRIATFKMTSQISFHKFVFVESWL
ncbi:hypothetical protein BSL78_17811 [Apostichopus japonicus]|uniref:Uncharacterized protein n=1 Tax=Stichopus japonicus TaxID=307972 RepID=A0A2G8KBE9_STIJA|nr:hypothetical protein BSL78_17811 [Apostichopus japonicus]